MSAQFDDGKEDRALRTIGEVAKALRIKPHVLRYWEQQFPVLQPLKRSGGRRYYRPEDVELVERIDRLVNSEGYTLKGARKALSGKAVPVSPSEKTPVPDNQAGPAAQPPSDDLPDAGGVDTFFGRTAAEPAAPEPQAPVEEDAAIEPEVPADVVAQLKSIRNRLAQALGA